MATFAFAPPAKFSFKAAEWTDWLSEFARYRIATKLHKETGDIQRDALLYSMGVKEAEKIMKTFTWGVGESDKSFEDLTSKFTNHFIPRVNIRHERAKFCERVQRPGETVAEFVRDLYDLVNTCGYADENDQILDRVVQGVRDAHVRRKLQLDDDLNLHKALSIAQQYEMIKSQEEERNTQSQDVSEAYQRSKGRGNRGRGKGKAYHKSQNFKPQNKPGGKCNRCNGDHPPQSRCPASGQTCSYCRKKGHFRAACFKLKKQNKSTDEVYSEPLAEVHEVDGFWLESIEFIDDGDSSGAWYYPLQILDVEVKFKIDSGADITLINQETFRKMQPRPNLQPSQRDVNSPGGIVSIDGRFQAQISQNGNTFKFYVYVGNVRNNLLSRAVSTAMKLIQKGPGVEEVYGTAGLMKTEPTVIQVKPGAIPYKVTTPRRIAFPILDKVEEELKRMETEGIITKLTSETTDWCAPMCPVIKPNGKVRVTVDFKQLNKNVKRPNLMLYNLEDIAPHLVSAKWFSALDIASGFYQLPLSPDSAILTTFITPFGRYHFNRVPMGINLGPEEFQRKMNEILDGMPGVHAIMDDILVHGKTEAEHDQRLKNVMDKLEQLGVKLNKDKCFLKKKEVKYFGHQISEHGIKPSADKIEAITKMPPPKNLGELRTIMGMLNYHAKFINNLADTIKPMSDLLKSDAAWLWGPAQEKAFKEAKAKLSKAPSLSFYRSDRHTVVSADASSFALGATLMQEIEGQLTPIAYASRTLSSAETNYAQIEKEGLASVWACEKFNRYLVGLPEFELWTDHKPLVPLMATKDLDQAPIRLQKILLRMMRFNCNVRHVPGKQLVTADALSRFPIQSLKEDASDVEEIAIHVDFIKSQWPISLNRQASLKVETAQDPILQTLTHYILHGWPKQVPKNLQEFDRFKGELSIVEGLITYHNRIVIPETQKQRILDVLHESHQGFDKCMENARSAVWWPSLSSDLKTLISTCRYCLERKPTQRYEPMKATDLPSRPWKMLGADIFFVQNRTFLVVVDYYSRWIEIKPLKTQTSEAVIKEMRNIFMTHGLPEILISDNGTQFVSSEFEQYRKEMGFTLLTSSPHFPHGNAEAERAVATAKRIVTQKNSDIALLNYRATPHSATKVSPAEALMGRKLLTKLPTLEKNLMPTNSRDTEIRNSDKRAKEAYTSSFNKRHGARDLPTLEPEDTVLFKKEKEDKVWTEGKVMGLADDSGRSYFIDTDRGEYRRNRKDIQQLPCANTCNEAPIEATIADKENVTERTMSPVKEIRRNPQRNRKTPSHLRDFVK
jgi:transposase InsO family protein